MDGEAMGEVQPGGDDAAVASGAVLEAGAMAMDAFKDAPDVSTFVDAAIADTTKAVPDSAIAVPDSALSVPDSAAADGRDSRPVDTGRETGTSGREAGPVDQYRAPVGPFSRALIETETVFSPENDGTWLMTDHDQDGVPDLVFIKTGTTDTGKVEVHIASASSGFQSRIAQAPSMFDPETDGAWLMSDYDRDGLPDLTFIKTGNTDTGTVEIHVASAASQYQTRILGTGSRFWPENTGTWLMVNYDRDGLPDLVFIKTGSPDTGTVEVHVASAAP